jgi:hypothetical protein
LYIGVVVGGALVGAALCADQLVEVVQVVLPTLRALLGESLLKVASALLALLAEAVPS